MYILQTMSQVSGISSQHVTDEPTFVSSYQLTKLVERLDKNSTSLFIADAGRIFHLRLFLVERLDKHFSSDCSLYKG